MREAVLLKADEWSSFSEDCLAATKAFLRARGLPEHFDEARGRGEHFWSSMLTEAESSYELFIYPDAAGFWRDRERWLMFERADFKRERDQIDAFLNALESSLDQPNRRSG